MIVPVFEPLIDLEIGLAYYAMVILDILVNEKGITLSDNSLTNLIEINVSW